ncbi:UNVERIFIED_CONTAM: hypothetical protein Sradi_3916400 [Sesamum radiatum]|uniref:Uncharacterized protein n=1 Tax=Sesamum radiatum TaxID=300843 RepID=A0AAW2PEX1_SESRA
MAVLQLEPQRRQCLLAGSLFLSVRVVQHKKESSQRQLLWRKLKKEKKRMFRRQCCCSNSMRFTYDPHSYSQNFDQGSSIWADPDDLSRSFSARFAVPSTIFDKNRLMV